MLFVDLLMSFTCLGLDPVHSHDHPHPGHILHVVVEIILQDGGHLHVIEPHLVLHQGEELNHFCGWSMHVSVVNRERAYVLQRESLSLIVSYVLAFITDR